MRLTSVKHFVLMCALLGISIGATAQAPTITLNIRNGALSTVLERIEKQIDKSFFYEEGLIDLKERVSINIKDADLATIINTLFNGTIVHSFVENHIVLKKAAAGKATDAPERANATNPSQLNVLNTQAQDAARQSKHSIRGIVIDKEGPVPQSTVVVKGITRKYAIADAGGRFELADIDPLAVLIVRCIGYETREVPVERKSEITITLQEMANLLENVVVTGYQTISKERATGSFSVVGQTHFEKRNNYGVMSYLEGQVPGLLTSSSGSLTIRGLSTINATRDPLIVVDGFPIDRPLESLNSADIEKITVLKDASAASIWGVRAANGVIVIDTKRGKSDQNRLMINFSGAISVSARPDYSTLPYASAASFIEVEKHRVDNNMTYFVGKPLPSISPVVDAYLHNPSQADHLVQSLKGINSYDEFADLFTQPAIQQHYALSFSGNSPQSNYRGSFGYNRNNSAYKQNYTERFSVDLFNSFRIAKSLSLDMGINAVYNTKINNGMSISDLNYLLPYQRILDNLGNYVNQPFTFYQTDKEALVEIGYPYNWDYNLMKEYRNKNNKDRETDVTALVKLKYELFKGFSANLGYQYEYGVSKTAILYNEETYYVRNMVNTSTAVINNQLVSGYPVGSVYRESNSDFYTHTWRGMLQYDGHLAPNHLLSIIAGSEIREVGREGSSQTKYGFNEQTLLYTLVDYTQRYIDVRGSQQLIQDGTRFSGDLNRFVSLFTNAGYTYNNKYTLSASARQDRTNLFGTSKKYKNVWLWSMGASWQIAKEEFFTLPQVDLLTLRLSYGINGNVDRTTSPFLVASMATDYNTNRPYAYIRNPENPMLRWEKTAVTNIGLDFSLFDRRLRGSIEYYQRASSDLLGDATVNGTYGFNSAKINYANMKNNGIDLQLSGALIDGAFSWNTTLNYSYNKNEVTNVEFPQETVGAYLSSVPKEGKPMNYIFSYQWAGLSTTGTPQVYNEEGEAVGYTSEMANPAALIYHGTATPPHYGAFIHEFSYRGLSLIFNFTYKFGHYFRIPIIQYESLMAGSSQVHKDWDNRWKNPGDEAITHIPKAPASITGLSIHDRYTRSADIQVATASHIRLRELLLNYSLPRTWFRNNPFATGVSIGLQVRNLHTWSLNKENIDPEYSGSWSMPPRPEYSIILRANF